MKHYNYPEDIDRIRRVAWAHGWDVPRGEAMLLWLTHSGTLAASWLLLPDNDDDLWAILSRLVAE